MHRHWPDGSSTLKKGEAELQDKQLLGRGPRQVRQVKSQGMQLIPFWYVPLEQTQLLPTRVVNCDA